MLRLNQSLVQELKQQKISELTVRIISGGCAGSKIEVLSGAPKNKNDYLVSKYEDILIHIPITQREYLDHGLVSKSDKGYLFTHPKIKSRCGCASSFSFEEKGKIASLHVLKDLKKKFEIKGIKI